jgi:hypothetical protein
MTKDCGYNAFKRKNNFQKVIRGRIEKDYWRLGTRY